MNTTTPPDFEKLAKQSWQGMVQDDEDPDYEVGYYNGCLKIWNDYVLSEKQKTDELLKGLIECFEAACHGDMNSVNEAKKLITKHSKPESE